MRRKRHWIALAFVLYLADCFFLGYTPENYFLSTRVELKNQKYDLAASKQVVMPLGSRMALDACLYDGSSVSMSFFVADCAHRHPWLFRGESTGEGAVYWDKHTLTAVRPGPFSFTIWSMGHGVSFSGEVVEVPDISLSTSDTTLHVGEELTVHWRMAPVANGRPPLAGIQIHVSHEDGSIWWKQLSDASPGAVRIRALEPGYECLGIVEYTSTTWLRVVVVDSAGKSRLDSKPVSPDSVRCGTPTAPAPLPSAATSAVHTPLLTSPLADTITAQGARLAFAFQRCVAHAMRAGSLKPDYSPQHDLGACSDSVQSIGPAWRISSDLAAPYTATFRYYLNIEGVDGAARTVRASGPDLMVTVHDQRELNGQVMEGPEATLQGDEIRVIRSAAACTKLFERETGHIAPSIRALRAFALSKASDKRENKAAEEACDYGELAALAERSGESKVLVDELGRFTLRYFPRGASAAIEVRPVRWGETGVVSYRYEAPGILRRTLEDRAPNARDERYDAKTDRWMHGGG